MDACGFGQFNVHPSSSLPVTALCFFWEQPSLRFNAYVSDGIEPAMWVQKEAHDLDTVEDYQ